MRPRQRQTDLQTTPSHPAAYPSGVASDCDLGDDLARSRLFALKAGAEMTAIVEASRDLSPSTGLKAEGRDPVWLCEKLSIIQREAKRARARAVYRSAQDVLALIQRCNVHMPINWTRVDGRLFVLNKLLSQYEDGLSELERQSPPDLLTSPTTSIEGAPSSDIAVEVTFDPVQEIAKQTLASLLPHARDDERAALQSLIDLTHDDVSVETDEILDANVASEPPKSDPAPDRIEWIMPALVQDLLEVGRDYGKLFSVSHTLDDVLIAAGQSDQVRARLFERLSDIIKSDLPLQGVGRLDLQMGNTHLQVSGSGFDPVEIDLPESVPPSLLHIAEDIEKPESDPTRRPSPRITDDTEADLRAQLSALMTGGLDEDG